MKKFLLIFLIIGSVIAFASYNRFANSQSVSVSIPAPKTTTVKVDKSIGKPSKLTIDSINVEAQMEHVGLDSKRNMDIPKDDMNVAWYNLGPKPGEAGSAVIAGHLDRRNGDPAVFWDLEKLKIGEEIKVTDDKGNDQTFKVIRIKTYPFDKFPLQEVFADDSGTKLNLITCGGIFDTATKNYSNRTVVYAELVD